MIKIFTFLLFLLNKDWREDIFLFLASVCNVSPVNKW